MCAMRPPVINFEQMIRDFAANIKKFATDRAALKVLSGNTLQRAYDFSFEERRKFFNRQYDLAIQDFAKKNTEQ